MNVSIFTYCNQAAVFCTGQPKHDRVGPSVPVTTISFTFRSIVCSLIASFTNRDGYEREREREREKGEHK